MRLDIRFAVFASSLVAMGAGPADAQSTKYYARQQLPGLVAAQSQQTQPYTYVPKYGAYGACSNGSQTASIVSCTRSDGTVVANGMCSPATISQSCAPTITCAAPRVNYWINYQGSSSYTLAAASSAADAQAGCQAKATELGKSGACFWNRSSGALTFGVGGNLATSANNNLYASYCQ